MKVAFRADASIVTGSGHVMRCLTLADALREQGVHTVFLCRYQPGHLGNLISARGHTLVWLPAHEGIDWFADAEASVANLAAGAPWDWLVVDHYDLAADWERRLRDVAKNIMVIDDLANREHDCNLLLDQNLQDPDRYAGLVPKTCCTLIGPKYALLRPQFATARRSLRPRDGHVSRLLVFFGSMDVDGVTIKALEAIKLLGRPDLHVDIVVGQANPHQAAIEAASQTLARAEIHYQTEAMATLMANADLFLGAGGSSSWERCCLGLPALVLATAENQVEQSVALARAGVQAYLGPASAVDVAHLARALATLIGLPDLLVHMARKGEDLVDGRGTTRIFNRLMVSRIRLRRACIDDCAALYTWRNHPEIRRHAFDSAEIDWETHKRWLTTVLADPNRELLIAEREGQPIGVLRYDIRDGRAFVSIYLVPGLAGQGLGVQLLLNGESWLLEQRKDVQTFEAEIRADNQSSIMAFQAAGFVSWRTSLKKDVYENQ